MSAEHYDWLRDSVQRSQYSDDTTDMVIDAMERAELDVEYRSLDDLLKSQQTGAASQASAGPSPMPGRPDA